MVDVLPKGLFMVHSVVELWVGLWGRVTLCNSGPVRLNCGRDIRWIFHVLSINIGYANRHVTLSVFSKSIHGIYVKLPRHSCNANVGVKLPYFANITDPNDAI